MDLREIYCPVKEELKLTEKVLETSFRESGNQSILKMGGFLLESPGKRIRPALVILSAKANLNPKPANPEPLISIAAAVELIHMASLIHDDIIDRAYLRHSKLTVNSKWGEDVSIALGDYLYSVAFELISDCGNSDVIRCMSSAAKTMSEGELLQVCERDNLDLLEKIYILIVKKKTASLFAASCQVGALISNSRKALQKSLKEYGLNFGIAFQITDDYFDLAGKEENIGKTPGQDIKAGEITLPIMNLWGLLPQEKREEMKRLLKLREGKKSLEGIREVFFNSGAANKTEKTVLHFIKLAKEKINTLSYSPYKESLVNLADFLKGRGLSVSPL